MSESTPNALLAHQTKAVIDLVVNGERRRLTTDPARTLLEVLRDDLDLTGTKYGCGEGQCGACSVHVDDQVRRACLVRIHEVAGKTVRTIEGLAEGERLHPVQTAFLDAGAFQCGYCTSGMIMCAAALLAKHPDPSDTEIIRSMNSNLCRCCVHPRIVAAVRNAAGAIAESRPR
jgi:aerobic-type carbon monoxide dehydrogenase small subunit (CoxS/CutS family)